MEVYYATYFVVETCTVSITKCVDENTTLLLNAAEALVELFMAVTV